MCFLILSLFPSPSIRSICVIIIAVVGRGIIIVGIIIVVVIIAR